MDDRVAFRPDAIRKVVHEGIVNESACLEVEIGCSHGEFLVSLASAYPDRFFIGVEVDFGKCQQAEERGRRRASPL